MQAVEDGDTELHMAQEGGTGTGQTVPASRGDTLARVLSHKQDETVREKSIEESFRRAEHEILEYSQQRR